MQTFVGDFGHRIVNLSHSRQEGGLITINIINNLNMNTRPVGVYLLELMVGRRGQFFSQELLIGGRLLIKLLAHSSQVLSLPATRILSPTFVSLLFFSNLHQGWPHGGSRLAWFEFILGNTFSLGIEKPPSSRDCSMRHLLQSLV